MTTMNDAERAGFEDVYPAAKGLLFEDGKYAKRHESRWQSDAVEVINRMWQDFQAGAAWQRAQWAVPNVSAMARVLSDRSADACNIDRTDNWAMYGQEYIEDVQAMLSAATAHPAERQEQGEVQRLREALEHCLDVMKDPWKHGEGCISRAIYMADAALAASTGQEGGKA